eukprot:tig00000821_g4517.t1
MEHVHAHLPPHEEADWKTQEAPVIRMKGDELQAPKEERRENESTLGAASVGAARGVPVERGGLAVAGGPEASKEERAPAPNTAVNAREAPVIRMKGDELQAPQEERRENEATLGAASVGAARGAPAQRESLSAGPEQPAPRGEQQSGARTERGAAGQGMEWRSELERREAEIQRELSAFSGRGRRAPGEAAGRRGEGEEAAWSAARVAELDARAEETSRALRALRARTSPAPVDLCEAEEAGLLAPAPEAAQAPYAPSAEQIAADAAAAAAEAGAAAAAEEAAPLDAAGIPVDIRVDVKARPTARPRPGLPRLRRLTLCVQAVATVGGGARQAAGGAPEPPAPAPEAQQAKGQGGGIIGGFLARASEVAVATSVAGAVERGKEALAHALAPGLQARPAPRPLASPRAPLHRAAPAPAPRALIMKDKPPPLLRFRLIFLYGSQPPSAFGKAGAAWGPEDAVEALRWNAEVPEEARIAIPPGVDLQRLLRGVDAARLPRPWGAWEAQREGGPGLSEELEASLAQ